MNRENTKEVNMKFGIELECYNNDITTVVGALRTVGIDAIQSGYSGREYTKWQIKTDCSIQGNKGFEVVSPILEGEDGIAQARKVCDTLVAIGSKVNSSCGFHIHHDVTGWDISKFKNLFKRFAKYESALDLVQPSTRRANNNRYCKSNVVGSIQQTFARIGRCYTLNALSRVYGENRYFKLNLQSFFRMGSIEFRNHSGTVDADKVENYIRLTYGFILATNKNIPISAPKQDCSAKDNLNSLLGYFQKIKITTPQVTSFYQARARKFEAQV